MFLLPFMALAAAEQSRCIALKPKPAALSSLVVKCSSVVGASINDVGTFDTVVNTSTGALCIRTSFQGVTRVFLVIPDTQGRPFVQEVTRDLTRKIGRNPDAGLQNTMVDISLFATTMSIGVTDITVPSGANAQLDLAPYLALSRQILSTASTQEGVSK